MDDSLEKVLNPSLKNQLWALYHLGPPAIAQSVRIISNEVKKSGITYVFGESPEYPKYMDSIGTTLTTANNSTGGRRRKGKGKGKAAQGGYRPSGTTKKGWALKELPEVFLTPDERYALLMQREEEEAGDDIVGPGDGPMDRIKATDAGDAVKHFKTVLPPGHTDADLRSARIAKAQSGAFETGEQKLHHKRKGGKGGAQKKKRKKKVRSAKNTPFGFDEYSYHGARGSIQYVGTDPEDYLTDSDKEDMDYDEETGDGPVGAESEETDWAWVKTLEMTLKNGKKRGLITPKDTDGSEIRWMEDFIVEAIRYYFIYGMVPYTKGNDTKTGYPRLIIPDITTGNFVATYDDNNQSIVQWKFHDQFVKHGKVTGYVFVWEDSRPILSENTEDGNPFNSVVHRLMDDWMFLKAEQGVKLTADFLCGNAPLVHSSTEKMKGIEEFGFEEIFADALAMSTNVRNVTGSIGKKQKYRLEMDDLKMFHSIAKQAKSGIPEEFFSNQRQTVIGPDFKQSTISRVDSWENNYYPLPAGRVTQSVTLPKTVADYIQILDEFHKQVSRAFGVPLEHLGQGGGGHRSSAEAAGEMSLFRATMEHAKRAGKEALEEAFPIALRDEESKSIMDAISAVNNSMSRERTEVLAYEAIYNNMNAKDKKERGDQALAHRSADIQEEIAQKMHEIVTRAASMGASLDPGNVREYLHDRILNGRVTYVSLGQHRVALIKTLQSKKRLKIQWKIRVTTEELYLLEFGVKMGFVSRDVARKIFLMAASFPDDTPAGMTEEEESYKLKVKYEEPLAAIALKYAPKPAAGTGSSSSSGGGKSKPKSSSSSSSAKKSAPKKSPTAMTDSSSSSSSSKKDSS